MHDYSVATNRPTITWIDHEETVQFHGQSGRFGRRRDYIPSDTVPVYDQSSRSSGSTKIEPHGPPVSWTDHSDICQVSDTGSYDWPGHSSPLRTVPMDNRSLSIDSGEAHCPTIRWT